MARRALVTGVAGFMGSHVADSCLVEGMEVVGVDDLSGGLVRNIPSNISFRRLSVADEAAVLRLWQTDGPFDYVFHLAAYAAEGLSHFVRRFNYENNLLASINLINESVKNGVERFVFTSSIAVYGSAQPPMTETTTPSPVDPYGIAKYGVELDLRAAQEMFGLNYTIFRPHNVYGERQNIADPYRNVIGIFMNQGLSGRPMTIFGDGVQTRAFTHVDDVAPVIARSVEVAESANEVFNIGADEPYSVLRLAHVVANALGIDPNVVHLPPRHEVVHAFSDHVKVRSVFGYSSAVSLEDGVQRMSNWVSTTGPQEPVAFGNIEVRQALPPSWSDL